MYGQIFNVPIPSAGIHTFILKWDTTRVPYGMPLQEYTHTFNIPQSNANNYLLQTAINQEITVGYKFYSQKS